MKEVDRFCRWIDYPFMPDEWIRLYETNGQQTIRAYSTLVNGGAYDGLDWNDINEKWRAILAKHEEDQNIGLFTSEWRSRMVIKWQGEFPDNEFLQLEYLYEDIMKTQNVLTGTQNDQARKLCKLSLLADKQIRAGTDFKDALKSYNDLIKSAEFGPKNAKNAGDFDSVGELALYLVKKGYMPKFYDNANRDEVDVTMKNTQLYLRNLVLGEPTLQDQALQRLEMYRVATEMEKEGYRDMDADLDKYDAQGEEVELEGEFEVEDD
jgi:hypothetical protein